MEDQQCLISLLNPKITQNEKEKKQAAGQSHIAKELEVSGEKT